MARRAIRMSKREWLIVFVVGIAAFAIGWPYLKHGFIGSYLSGKCDEAPASSKPECHVSVP